MTALRPCAPILQIEGVVFDAETFSILFRLLVAAGVGSLLGLDREMRGKPAGLRTHALVSLGAALVTSTVVEISGGLPAGADAVSRVIQGIVAGVGFLGAGSIIRARSSDEVQGLTTAASIWLVASFGVACGAGYWRSAFIAAIIALVLLVAGGPVEGLVQKFGPRYGNGRDRRTPKDRAD